MTPIVIMVALAIVSFSAGWVYRDARTRGIPTDKALTWAALQGVEWPLFLWLYHRARPKGTRPLPPS
jgi:hypothetical protein